MIRYVLLLLLSGVVIAESSSVSLSLPSASTGMGSDSIKAGDLDCKNSIGGSTNFELGVVGYVNNVSLLRKDIDNPQTKDLGVYARIIIPLDGPKERINCNTLYKLELQRRRLEVEKLRAEIEMLKSLQFDN
jgi:outer membrane receptor for monomeric catechols